MTAPLVRVVDHVPYEAAVSPAQALAYCRRVLVGWEEPPDQHMAKMKIRVDMIDRVRGMAITIPLCDFVDYPRRMAELCNDLVALGFASRPSEALRAMAGEVVA